MNKKFYLLFTLLFCLLLNFSAANAQNTSVYVSAHPDDWQLFMNPNAYHSVKSANEKVVFLHITAGDMGGGTGNNYYLAREEGSLRAIRFMSNTFTSGEGLGSNMNKTVVTVNGHKILKYTYRNAVAYFFRLPDGGNGDGFPIHKYYSLEKLYKGSIQSIPAIDNSTTYSSLSDLKATLQAVVESEAAATNKIFNLADTDVSINPYDHSDHLHSSLLMQSIASTIGGVTMNMYIDYYTDSKQQNVFNDDFMLSAGTWGVTTSGVSDNLYYSGWDKGHNAWIGKQYFRTIQPKSNTGVNIALHKPTTASSSEGGAGNTKNAVDNNYSLSNWWGASRYAQWWQVDLGDKYDLSKLVVFNYYDGARYYQYDIQGSLDGTTWTRLVNFNDNRAPATSSGNAFPLTDTTARYLRVNMNYNSANAGVHIIEFEAYGKLSAYTASSTSSLKALDESTSKPQADYNLLVYPNPTRPGSPLRPALDLPHEENIHVEVLTVDGKKLLGKAYKLSSGANEVEIPSTGLTLGMLLVKVEINGKIITKKVFLE